MFNSTDSQKKTISVTIELASGEQLVGNIVVRATVQSLADQLNKPEPFIEFEGLDGSVLHIGKASIASVKQMNIPKADELSRRLTGNTIDPYRTLGIQNGASPEEVRSAYLALAMKYHPDRYARVDLPREMEEYLSSTLGRINAAYQMLGGNKKDRVA